jgi:hypothetical protein
VTCETDGNIAYYQCSCGRKFKDKSAKTELTDEEIVIPATGHDLELVEKVPATCDEDGNKQYYKCKNCGNLYWDELATSPVSDSSDLVLGKHGHYYINTTYKWSADHSKVTATCYCKYDSSHIITETVDTVFTDNESERVYTAEFTDTHFTKQTVTVDISPAKILLGDLDKDGTVDVKDATLLTRYVNGWAGIIIDLDAADLDRDGEVTLRDAMILTRYANAWDGYDTYIIEVEA